MRRILIPSFAVLILGSALLVGCGGEGANALTPGTAARISLNSTSVNLSPGAKHNFAATMSGANGGSVTWSVVGGASSGTITPDGVYTAPDQPGSYTVLATSTTDPSVSSRATVTVQKGLNLTIAPQNQQLKLGDRLQFTASITGGDNTKVVWEVKDGDKSGTITPEGLYTAPLTAGTYTVSAKSEADATKLMTTQVNVVAGTEVKIDFPTAELITVPGSTVKFAARVVGNTDTKLKWTVQEGEEGGAIGADGTWTAPPKPGTYTLVATSLADGSKKLSRTVKVVAAAKALITIEGRGEMLVSLDSKAAPVTCAQFVSLANAGFYKGIKFHRVETPLVQAGDPFTRTLEMTDPKIGTGGAETTIPFEKTGILHVRGVLSMARGKELDSASSQWFIVRADMPEWDGQYAAFGKVESGLSVVDAIAVGDVITNVVIKE